MVIQFKTNAVHIAQAQQLIRFGGDGGNIEPAVLIEISQCQRVSDDGQRLCDDARGVGEYVIDGDEFGGLLAHRDGIEAASGVELAPRGSLRRDAQRNAFEFGVSVAAQVITPHSAERIACHDE